MYRTDFWTLWEKARVGCFKRTALKPVYYLGWNRSPAQVRCMRQVLGPGALGKPRGNGWRGRWEGVLGWGTHVNPWLFHFNVWQNPPQIKKEKKNKVKLVSQTCKIYICFIFRKWQAHMMHGNRATWVFIFLVSCVFSLIFPPFDINFSARWLH